MRHGTYSIVAFDPASGRHGVAVQSHWFSVGPLCAFARPGVGAVATQSVVEPAYGPGGLDRLAAGEAPDAALRAMLDGDELATVRQVGMVDAQGRVAAHTGADCIPRAGHVTGNGVACQANMMRHDGVPEAMLAGFEAAEGELAARLLAALQAAEGAGGDVRGRQSAALTVVESGAEPWRRLVDLRVEDSGDPIVELERLLRLHRAYAMADEADQLLGAGLADQAAPLYRQAAGIAPESDELLFWAGLAVALHDPDEGTAIVRRAAEVHDGWLTLLDRLSADFAPAGDEVRRRLGR